jgi:hypothetical protein
MQHRTNDPRKRRSKLPAGNEMRERGGRSTQRRERRPAGDGGPRQSAGGPEHRGLPAEEDRNP